MPICSIDYLPHDPRRHCETASGNHSNPMRSIALSAMKGLSTRPLDSSSPFLYPKGVPTICAEVAELADALASGVSERKLMGVQIPPSASSLRPPLPADCLLHFGFYLLASPSSVSICVYLWFTFPLAFLRLRSGHALAVDFRFVYFVLSWLILVWLRPFRDRAVFICGFYSALCALTSAPLRVLRAFVSSSSSWRPWRSWRFIPLCPSVFICGSHSALYNLKFIFCLPLAFLAVGSLTLTSFLSPQGRGSLWRVLRSCLLRFGFCLLASPSSVSICVYLWFLFCPLHSDFCPSSCPLCLCV